MSEQAVIFHVILDEGFDLDEVEAGLESVAAEQNAEYDGNELAVDGSEAILYLDGSDADALFDAAAPVVRRAAIKSGSHARKRYGSADDPA